MIIAIDPGKQGAIAYMADGSFPAVEDLRYLGDIPDVCWIRSQVPEQVVQLVVIEQPIAMPGQSSVATATSFRAYGALLAWATLAEVPLITPRPGQWKAKLGVTKDKGSAVALAARLFPSAGLYGPRGAAKDGRAEALLLAEYGRRFHLGLTK